MEKSIVLNNYVEGLFSFLYDRKIKCKELPGDKLEIFYTDEYQLFLIGFHFGRYHEHKMYNFFGQ